MFKTRFPPAKRSGYCFGFEFLSFEIRICFGPFYKIGRYSDFEFSSFTQKNNFSLPSFKYPVTMLVGLIPVL